MTEGARRPRSVIRTRMTARDIREPHRASSPLELLFDLTFVVAVAQVAAQLAHTVAAGHPFDGIGPYLMVFFAIWWAWMNFTWFASAFDTDDVPYRLFTLVQMAGVLVLAAGVHSAFSDQDFTAITIGYFIMRLGLIGQWLRAAVEDPADRRTALRYAGAIALVQLGWIARLFVPLPETLVVPVFVLLALLDLSVPIWAERTGGTNWHAHHIAERYGLFTIIVLGESVAAATTGVARALESGLSLELVVTAAAGLALLLGLWWLYFLEPVGAGLHRRRSRSFFWGYGHYFMFAALAAVGAGLEVAVDPGAAEHAPALVIAYALAIPVAVVLLLIWALGRVVLERLRVRPVASITAAVIVLLLPLLAPAIGVPLVVVGIALAVAVLVAFTIVDPAHRVPAAATEAGEQHAGDAHPL